MLNAIGLQNPGIDTLIARDLPYLHEHGAHIIVNVCGRSKEDYVCLLYTSSDIAPKSNFHFGTSFLLLEVECFLS